MMILLVMIPPPAIHGSSAARRSHRRGCEATSPAARASVTALAVEEMDERRAKTEEGPCRRPKNTLRDPASGVIRGGGTVPQPQERRGRCGCMLWWWRMDGCVVKV
eukprot:scaffold74933_cov37-Cyclotella_meneghiniana.AAC.1